MNTSTETWIPTRDGFGQEIVRLGRDDHAIIVMSADLEDATRAESFKFEFPDRFFNTGIAEQDMVGTAAGLSLMGFKPVICSFAVFMTNRAYDMIRLDICYNRCDVKIVCTHAGVTVGEDGASAQSLEDLALMTALPHMTVICPVDARQAVKATAAMMKHEGPVFLRLSRAPFPLVTSEEDPFEIGRMEVLREGDDVAFLACGRLVYECLRAADRLKEEGIEAAVLNAHTIKPMDEHTLAIYARRCGAVVTAEEHQINGGLGAAAACCLARHHPVPMEFIAVADRFGQTGNPGQLLAHYRLTADDVAEAARRVLRRKHAR